ncbi:FGGY family carbohydrate kinase [Rhodovulum sp. DZ06]|uniref:FGGY family carbohydrate kinase n=1 Tax=Rhodovulum sp. DZ06 TaxID=3425126 RepID=UPI003D33A623
MLIGLDAGTSVIKAVAFDLSGRQVAAAAVPNRYVTRPDGAAVQDQDATWADAADALRALSGKVGGLAARAAALAVTAQGDGTWLVGKDDAPVGEGWIWLDSRSAPTVRALRAQGADAARYAATGTGLNCCQQGAQLAHMQSRLPHLLEGAECALHPRDFLFLRLTGLRVSDPSETCFTFGDFRTRTHDEAVIDALGLRPLRRLLPEIMDGARDTAPLSAAAAAATGLRAGLPVSLGYVDVACMLLGGGIFTGTGAAGCSIIGSTGMHARCIAPGDFTPNPDRTGYVMLLPIEGRAAQLQSNMAATLNIDRLLDLAADLLADFGAPVDRPALLGRLSRWLEAAEPGRILYHPYISEAGERGPIVEDAARASFIGLNSGHRFPDLARAAVEGLALAAADCYAAMGPVPAEIRLSGGAARSDGLRGILGAALGVPVRRCEREEAGAAGAAMTAAVAIGAYLDMQACIDAWVAPLLTRPEAPDPALSALYTALKPHYLAARDALPPVWRGLAATRGTP